MKNFWHGVLATYFEGVTDMDRKAEVSHFLYLKLFFESCMSLQSPDLFPTLHSIFVIFYSNLAHMGENLMFQFPVT